ncbi:MAG: hypothetical protein ACLUJC_05910 [Clostridia bacterium]
MKRAIGMIVILSLFIFTTAIPAFAVDSDYNVLRAANYSYANAGLNISAGEATATGIMQGIPGVTTKITVHLYLQQYKDGKWVDYDDWTKTEKGVNCTLSETVSVPKGYTYRAKASCYAYAGSKSEHVTKYSSEVKY